MSGPFEILSEGGVVGKKGKVEVSSFTGDKKVVGIYFSAHWCPPCRGFTPKLAEWYSQVVGSDKFKGKLEIVFASSDRDQASFDEYYATMPFLALDYEGGKDAKQKLSDKYGVRGIPTLVFLNGSNGEEITKDGRSLVMSNNQAELEKYVQ